MTQPQPLIAVRDVEASSRWYQRLLDCDSAHGGTEYERLAVDGELVLQLHAWDVDHHHGAIGDPEARPSAMASCCGSRSRTSTRPSSAPTS